MPKRACAAISESSEKLACEWVWALFEAEIVGFVYEHLRWILGVNNAPTDTGAASAEPNTIPAKATATFIKEEGVIEA